MRQTADLSVLDFTQLGSTLSLRHAATAGSTFSVYPSSIRNGLGISVLQCTYVASSISLRTMLRAGCSLSTIDLIRI
jgi:hypothetical protein